MPEWVDIHDRVPEKFGQYYVKVNGMKNIFRLDEFHKAKDRYDSFLWLDEDAKPAIQIVPKETIISAFRKGTLKDVHINQLTNLLGVRKANKIKLTNTANPVTT